jgi:hypothetical protein
MKVKMKRTGPQKASRRQKKGSSASTAEKITTLIIAPSSWNSKGERKKKSKLQPHGLQVPL